MQPFALPENVKFNEVLFFSASATRRLALTIEYQKVRSDSFFVEQNHPTFSLVSFRLLLLYGMGSIPCDTSIREILDGVDPNDLRPLFKDAFKQLQRGKIIEKFVFMEGSYLLNLDGTGYFSSDSLHSDACLEKRNKKTGKLTYYLQTVGAAVVHHDIKEVIVLPPETIKKQDGETKMDCERNAIRRFLGKLR